MAAIAGASGLINPSTIDLATSQADIERRRQLAMALLAGAGGMGQTQMAGNIAIRKSPWEFLARMGTAGIGGHDLRALNDEQQGLVSSVQQRQADALQELFAAGQGTPATPAQADKGSFPAAEFDSSTPVVLPGQQAQPPDVNRMSAAMAKGTNAGVDPKIMADQLTRWQNNMDLPPEMQPWNNGPVGGLGMNAGGDFTDASGAASPQAAAMAQALGSGGGGGASAGVGGTFMGLPMSAAKAMLSNNPRFAALGKESIEASKAAVNRPGSQLTNPLTGEVISQAPPEGYQWTDKSQTTLRKIPGYSAGKAEEAGAVTAATAAAGAPYQFHDVQFSDGSVQTMTADRARQIVPNVPGAVDMGPAKGMFPVTPARAPAPARASGGGGQGPQGVGAVYAAELAKMEASGQVDPQLASAINGLKGPEKAAFDAARSGAAGMPQVRPTSDVPEYDRRPGVQPMPRNVTAAPTVGGQSTGAKAEAEANAGIYAKQSQAVDERAFTANEATARNEAMLTALPAFKSGAGSELRMKAARVADAANMPWLSKALMDGGSIPAQQIFNKDAYQSSLSGIKQVLAGQRITQQEVAQNYINSPNSSLNAESSEMLLKYQLGVAQWAKDMQQARDAWTEKGSYKGFESAWNRTHPVSAYVPSVEAMEKVFYPNGKPNPSTKVNNQTRTGAVGGSGQAARTVVGTGTQDGRAVVKYSDGSIDWAQ